MRTPPGQFRVTFGTDQRCLDVSTADVGQGVCLVVGEFIAHEFAVEHVGEVEIVMSTHMARRVATALLQAADAADDAEREFRRRSPVEADS